MPRERIVQNTAIHKSVTTLGMVGGVCALAFAAVTFAARLVRSRCSVDGDVLLTGVVSGNE